MEETGFDDVVVVFQHIVSVVLLVLLDIREKSPVSPRLVLEITIHRSYSSSIERVLFHHFGYIILSIVFKFW